MSSGSGSGSGSTIGASGTTTQRGSGPTSTSGGAAGGAGQSSSQRSWRERPTDSQRVAVAAAPPTASPTAATVAAPSEVPTATTISGRVNNPIASSKTASTQSNNSQQHQQQQQQQHTSGTQRLGSIEILNENKQRQIQLKQQESFKKHLEERQKIISQQQQADINYQADYYNMAAAAAGAGAAGAPGANHRQAGKSSSAAGLAAMNPFNDGETQLSNGNDNKQQRLAKQQSLRAGQRVAARPDKDGDRAARVSGKSGFISALMDEASADDQPEPAPYCATRADYEELNSQQQEQTTTATAATTATTTTTTLASRPDINNQRQTIESRYARVVQEKGSSYTYNYGHDGDGDPDGDPDGRPFYRRDLATILCDLRASRKLVILIVAIALLLDNMLLTSVVPIIPAYLYRLRVEREHREMLASGDGGGGGGKLLLNRTTSSGQRFANGTRGPSMFSSLDRNRDGRLDEEELEAELERRINESLANVAHRFSGSVFHPRVVTSKGGGKRMRSQDQELDEDDNDDDGNSNGNEEAEQDDDNDDDANGRKRVQARRRLRERLPRAEAKPRAAAAAASAEDDEYEDIDDEGADEDADRNGDLTTATTTTKGRKMSTNGDSNNNTDKGRRSPPGAPRRDNDRPATTKSNANDQTDRNNNNDGGGDDDDENNQNGADDGQDQSQSQNQDDDDDEDTANAKRWLKLRSSLVSMAKMSGNDSASMGGMCLNMVMGGRPNYFDGGAAGGGGQRKKTSGGRRRDNTIGNRATNEANQRVRNGDDDSDSDRADGGGDGDGDDQANEGGNKSDDAAPTKPYGRTPMGRAARPGDAIGSAQRPMVTVERLRPSARVSSGSGPGSSAATQTGKTPRRRRPTTKDTKTTTTAANSRGSAPMAAQDQKGSPASQAERVGEDKNQAKVEEEEEEAVRRRKLRDPAELRDDELVINHQDIVDESFEVGVMFASKPIVQAIANPFVGAITNRVGFTLPMFLGFAIMFLSTLVFAFGTTYATLFLARAIQGVGSACTSVAGMSMIADRFPDDAERGNAMAIALGGLALGVVIGPPFGGFMYEFFGKPSPFIALALLALLDGLLQLLVLQPRVTKSQEEGASLMTLIRDPYILVAAGAITFANTGIGILEPALPLWMMDTMQARNWEQGVAFLPAALSYLFSTNLFGNLGLRIGRWRSAMLGLILIGCSLLLIPFATRVDHLILPNGAIGFAIGMVDSTMMPMLGYLVDIRHTSVYGSVYAIGDVAFCASFVFGPALSGTLVELIGFEGLVITTALICFGFAPLLLLLRNPPARQMDDEAQLQEQSALRYVNYNHLDSPDEEAQLTGGDLKTKSYVR